MFPAFPTIYCQNKPSIQYQVRILPIILQIAIAADRFTMGRRKLFATQVIIIWYADTAPSGIRNMAKYLAPVLRVETTMMFPTHEIINKQIIWIDRSPVPPEVYVTARDTRKVRNHTGDVSNRVAILLYPRVLTIVGKKYWNV